MIEDIFIIPNNPTIETKHKFYGNRRAKQWIEVSIENNTLNSPIYIVYNYGDRKERLAIPREMAFALAQTLTMVTPKLKERHSG